MSDDPARIIAAAVKLLNDKNVGKNVVYLLNVYLDKNDSISVNLRSDVDDMQREQLSIKKLDTCIDVEFGGKAFKIIVANLAHFVFDDSSSEHGDVYVIYDGECVLQNSISKDYDEWGGIYRVHFYDFSIKHLKAGIWLDDLNWVVNEIKSYKEKSAQDKQAEKLKATASKIDLSGIKF